MTQIWPMTGHTLQQPFRPIANAATRSANYTCNFNGGDSEPANETSKHELRRPIRRRVTSTRMARVTVTWSGLRLRSVRWPRNFDGKPAWCDQTTVHRGPSKPCWTGWMALQHTTHTHTHNYISYFAFVTRNVKPVKVCIQVLNGNQCFETSAVGYWFP